MTTGSGTRCASPVTIADTAGCVFGVQLAAASGQWASSEALTVAGPNSGIEIDYGNTTPSTNSVDAPISVTTLTVNGTGTLRILGQYDSFTESTTYPLIRGTTEVPAAADPYLGLNLSLPFGVTGHLKTVANELQLVVDSVFAPNISATGSPLAAMSTTYGTASSATSFEVSGTEMVAGITVTPPTGFEVSTTADFSSNVGDNAFPITVGSAGATIGSTTVYIRLKASAPVSGSYNAQDIVLSSTDATPVNVTTAASGNGVTARVLTFTGTKTYDTVASATEAQLAFSNNVDGANLTMSGSVTLASAAAGSQAITDFSALTLGGSAAGNYTLTGASGSVTVNPLALTFTGGKTYDATTSATAAQLTFTNNLDGANLTMSGSVTLASASVGSPAITNFSGLTLGGSAAGNYTLTGASGSVTVNPLALTFTGTKTFDGNATATAAQLVFGNNLNGANLTMSGSVTLTSATAGSQAITDFSGLTLGGSAAGNYTLTGASGSVTITGGAGFDTWAATGTLGPVSFNGDTNTDGVRDGLAFLLGADNPDDDATGLLPTVTESGGDLVLEFDCLASADRGVAVLNLQHDADLVAPWTSVLVPGAVGNTTDGAVSYVATANGLLIHIVATIDGTTAAVNGKLFGRLEGTEN